MNKRDLLKLVVGDVIMVKWDEYPAPISMMVVEAEHPEDYDDSELLEDGKDTISIKAVKMGDFSSSRVYPEMIHGEVFKRLEW